jgi:hypothetical protein
MITQIVQKLLLSIVFTLVATVTWSQAIKSEKAKIRINSTIAQEEMPPYLQIIEPKNLMQGVTFQSDRQSVTIAIKVINQTSETKVYINNIEVPPSQAGDILLKTVDLKNGSNLVTIAVRDKDKLVSETVYNILFIPQVNNISPHALNPGKYYALIVANGNYVSAEMATLKRPVIDAKALKEILTSKYTFDPENIYTLYDMRRDNLIITLDDIQRKLTPEDNLLIYYAGHGKMDEDAGIGYWLLSDATMSSRVNWFSNSALTDYIKAIKAKHIFLIADACYAGSIFYSRGVIDEAPPSIADVYKNKSRTAMTSGGTTEVNDDSKFSEILLDLLRNNSDMYVTSSQLFRSIEKPVMNSGSKTAPRFGIIQGVNDMQGDFIFILRAK